MRKANPFIANNNQQILETKPEKNNDEDLTITKQSIGSVKELCLTLKSWEEIQAHFCQPQSQNIVDKFKNLSLPKLETISIHNVKNP